MSPWNSSLGANSDMERRYEKSPPACGGRREKLRRSSYAARGIMMQMAMMAREVRKPGEDR